MTELISAEAVRSALNYDPETGIFTWHSRPIRESSSRTDIIWNNKYSGRPAGHLMCNGYLRVTINRIGYLAHRLAWLYMTGEWPKDQVDHINRQRSDNRWHNLREATHSQNRINSPRAARNKSGFKGVRWRPQIGKYSATICSDGRVYNLGSFETAQSAYAAYCAAAIRLHGEFARLK